MGDRRASASKTLAARKKKEEQEKARKAVLSAAKRDVENAKSAVGANERPAYRDGMKNANAGKTSDKTVKSPQSGKKIVGNTTRADAQTGGAARQTTNRNKAKETVVGNTTRSAVEKGGAARRTTNDNKAAQRAYERVLAAQLNTPLGQMANRSTSWSMLDQTKDIAQKVHWPQSAIDKMTEKQNTLHQQNVETAKPYDIYYDDASGTWRGGESYGEWKGAQIYNAPKAQTVQTDVLNKTREEAAKFEPVNPAQMTPAQKALHNLAKTRDTTQGASRAIESLTGHLPGRLGSGTESVLKGLAAWPYAFGETLDQSIADAKANWSNDTIANLNAQAAQLQREMNVRGLPASVRQEKLAQYNQLRAQINVLSAKNSVDMSLPGQVMMGEAGQASAQTLDGLSGWQRGLANAGMSIGQNLPSLALSAVAGPGVGLAMMAGQAGTQKMYELNARGVSADESLARGLVSGGIEALTEKIPLENFLNVARTGGVGAVKNVLKQMGIEATEEGASYVMNWAADKAARDPEATFSLQELASSMAGGALSGGIMGGAGTLLNGAVNLPNKLNRNANNQTATTNPNSDTIRAAIENAGGRIPGVPESADTNTRNNPTQPVNNAQAAPVQPEMNNPAPNQSAPSADMVRSAIENAGGRVPAELMPMETENNPEVRTMTQTPNYDVTGYTMSDAAVSLGNTLAQMDDPKATLNELKGLYQAAHDEAISRASDYVKSYQPQGVSILKTDDGRGYRASQNEDWYRRFYAQNGRAPRNADIPAIAEQLVTQDTTGQMFGFSALQKAKLDAMTELSERVFTRDGFTGFTQNQNGDVQALYDMTPNQIGTVRADESTGAAPSGFDPYTHAANEYGTIKPGEIPARMVDVPVSMDGETRTRQFTRTAMEAKATPDEMIPLFERGVEEGLFSYTPRKNKHDLDSALNYIAQNGYAKSFESWNEKMESGGSVTADDMIRAQIMYAKAAQSGDTATAMKLAGQLAAEGTRLGQAVQAMQMLKRITPEGKLAYIKRSVDHLNRTIKKAVKKKNTQNGSVVEDTKTALEQASRQVENEVRRSVQQADNVPVEEWAKRTGDDLAARIASRLSVRERKPQPVTRIVLSDLVKFAEEHALPQRAKNKQRTAVDRLTDYFANRSFYTEAWNRAREVLRERYKDNQDALDALEAFTQGTIDYSGDPLHEQKVIVSALLSDIRAQDGGMNTLLGRSALGAGEQDAAAIADRLVQATGVTGADETILRGAVKRNLNDILSDRKSPSVERMVRTALSEMQTSLTDIAKMNSEGRNQVGRELSTYLQNKFGVDAAFAESAGQIITDVYHTEVQNRARNILENRFAERGQQATRDFWKVFEEYANLGAFDSEYAQKATGNLFQTDGITLDPALVHEFMQAKTDAERAKIEERIYQNLADQVPGTWADKWNAWRYFAMLGNPRTHIRNILGNFMFYVPTKAKDITGAALENLFIQKEKRTKSIGPVGKEISDFVKQDFAEMKDVLTGSDKYNPKQAILQRAKPWSDNNIVGRALNSLTGMTSDALDAEDAFSLGIRYRDALGHYMKARGLKPADMTGHTLEVARNYAVQEAQQATFRDDSPVANALQRLENKNAATKLLVGGLIPFKKTPINIVKRGLEYSPAGFLKTGADAVRMVQQKSGKLENGTMTGTQIIDDLSKAFVGTGLMAAGWALAKSGLLNGADADEKKEQYLNDAAGVQSYSLNIGNYTYTVDWTAPASLPLFMGVELYNAMTGEKDENALNAVLSSLQNITEPVFNLTMLDGINSAIQSLSYGGNPISTAITDTVMDYVGQGVPTLFGQIARTIDDTRRSSSTPDKLTGVDTLDKFLRRQQAKIPVASQKLQPYLDVFGRETKNDSLPMRAFQNLISPGYIAERKDDGVEGHLMRLYDKTGDTDILPGKARSFKVDGEEAQMTGDELTAYTKKAGQGAYYALNQMFQTSIYQNMSDSDKVKAIQGVYSYAKELAKEDSGKGYQLSSGASRTRSAVESGAPVGAYLALQALQKSAASQAEDSNTPNPTDVGRRALLNAIQSDSTMSNEQKDAVAKGLVINAISDKQADKYAAIQNTVPALQYAASYAKYREIENDDSIASKDKNATYREWLKEQPYSVEVKNLIDANIVNDGFFMPKEVDVDYSSDESFYKSQASEGAQKKWGTLTGTYGISMEMAGTLYSACWSGKKAESVKTVMALTGWNKNKASSFYTECRRR